MNFSLEKIIENIYFYFPATKKDLFENENYKKKIKALAEKLKKGMNDIFYAYFFYLLINDEDFNGYLTGNVRKESILNKINEKMKKSLDANVFSILKIDITVSNDKAAGDLEDKENQVAMQQEKAAGTAHVEHFQDATGIISDSVHTIKSSKDSFLKILEVAMKNELGLFSLILSIVYFLAFPFDYFYRRYYKKEDVKLTKNDAFTIGTCVAAIVLAGVAMAFTVGLGAAIIGLVGASMVVVKSIKTWVSYREGHIALTNAIETNKKEIENLTLIETQIDELIKLKNDLQRLKDLLAYNQTMKLIAMIKDDKEINQEIKELNSSQDKLLKLDQEFVDHGPISEDTIKKLEEVVNKKSNKIKILIKNHNDKYHTAFNEKTDSNILKNSLSLRKDKLKIENKYFERDKLQNYHVIDMIGKTLFSVTVLAGIAAASLAVAGAALGPAGLFLLPIASTIATVAGIAGVTLGVGLLVRKVYNSISNRIAAKKQAAEQKSLQEQNRTIQQKVVQEKGWAPVRKIELAHEETITSEQKMGRGMKFAVQDHHPEPVHDSLLGGLNMHQNPKLIPLPSQKIHANESFNFFVSKDNKNGVSNLSRNRNQGDKQSSLVNSLLNYHHK